MELLWDLVIRNLSIWTGDSFYPLIAASFVTYLIWSIYLSKEVPTFVGLVFIFNVVSIDIALSMIRNGLSWAMIILGIALGKSSLRYIAFLSGILIHTTAFGFLFCCIPSYLITKYNLSKSIALINIIIVPLILGISLTAMNEFILGGIGDKHVGDLHLVGSGSWLIASYFIVLLILQLTSNIEYIKKHAITMCLIIWYLWMNIYIPWSFRIWGASIPLIAYAVWDLRGGKRDFMLLAWCLFSLYLFYLRAVDFG